MRVRGECVGGDGGFQEAYWAHPSHVSMSRHCPGPHNPFQPLVKLWKGKNRKGYCTTLRPQRTWNLKNASKGGLHFEEAQ